MRKAFAPVTLIHGNSSFCNLPESSRSDSSPRKIYPTVVQISWKNQVDPCFLVWSGEYSQINRLNHIKFISMSFFAIDICREAIEIPFTVARMVGLVYLKIWFHNRIRFNRSLR